MRSNGKLLAIGIVSASLLAGTCGCKAVGLGGVSFLGSFGGAFLGSLLAHEGVSSDVTTVERFCYENGVAVDCSTIPGQ